MGDHTPSDGVIAALPLEIKDTLRAIFGQMSLKTLGKCAQVCKKWNEAVDNSILLEEIDLEPKNNISPFEFASLALQEFPRVKSVKLPIRIIYLGDDSVCHFFNDVYPKGVKEATSLALPPWMESIGRDDQARKNMAHLMLDPLPKTCVHFNYVCFWPELFDIMTVRLSENLKTLNVLLNTQRKIHDSWDSLINLIKSAHNLQTLGLHFFESSSFYYGPNFDVLSENLTHVLLFATSLQHLNIPPFFKVDKVVEGMGSLPNLTYLYVEDKMEKSLPNTLLEKCTNLRHLHLQLDNPAEQYRIDSKNLRTLLINSSVNLNKITIDCPNLEVLKFFAPRGDQHINEVHVIGEHKLEEFTSKSPIISTFGDFSSVKVADKHTLMPGNREFLDLMPNLEKLTLENSEPNSAVIMGKVRYDYETLEWLTRLKSLNWLEMGKVTRFEEYEVLSRLTKLVLKECNLYGNRIHFKNLTNLRELHLHHCKDISAVKITGCHNITNLVLFYMDHLRSLTIEDAPNIEKLDIRNCNLNLDSWQELQKMSKLTKLAALVIPANSFKHFASRWPKIEISGKTVTDRVYEGGLSILGTVIKNVNWISKEEYDESGPTVRSSSPF